MTLAWRQFVWTFSVLGTIALTGCSPSEPVRFSHDSRLSSEEFAEKPLARGAVESIVESMYGDSPYRLRVPEGSGLPEGGRYLAGLVQEGEGDDSEIKPVVYFPAGSERAVPVVGGQALYHRHCLHCHGASGDGRGPTAPYFYPRPRDYRSGVFKFTSTEYQVQKPTRDDLRRVLLHGIDGSSMPSFRSLMSEVEIEQVIDYVIFLSMRGETERISIEEVLGYVEEDLADEEVMEYFEEDISYITKSGIFDRWNVALDSESLVRPLSPRVPSTPESIDRGRELFLGVSQENLQCSGCHGTGGKGDGPTWIDPETFNKYVFHENYNPEDPSSLDQLRTIAEEQERKWSDEWGDPLRPADLNKGVYKGGRRPIDIYWRIATGIPGTYMPAHAGMTSDPDDLWHLVNFVLALPQQPELLRADQIQRLGADSVPEAATTAAR